jgi:hypothetical protein
MPNSPIRDRAEYMKEYRAGHLNGGRGYKKRCWCGAEVWDLKRHQAPQSHPPQPGAEERAAALRQQREEWERERPRRINHLNAELWREDAAAAAEQPFSFYSRAFDICRARGWDSDDLRVGSYYSCGEGIALYIAHLKRMLNDQAHRKRVERERRESE